MVCDSEYEVHLGTYFKGLLLGLLGNIKPEIQVQLAVLNYVEVNY